MYLFLYLIHVMIQTSGYSEAKVLSQLFIARQKETQFFNWGLEFCLECEIFKFWKCWQLTETH